MTTPRKTAAAKPAPDKVDAGPQPDAAPDRVQSDSPVILSPLAVALVAFQESMPKVAKGNTATIPGKDGRSGYSYKYADLGDVSDAAVPLLAAQGLSFTCLPRLTANGGYELAGRLTHVSGEFLEGALPLFGRTAQELGSSITYHRRYLLGCMTGIVTDEDEDGAIAQAHAHRPESDPAPVHLAPHQQIVADTVETLTSEEFATLQAWARTNKVPAVADLTSPQAQNVMAYLEWLVGQRQPADDNPAWVDPAAGEKSDPS